VATTLLGHSQKLSRHATAIHNAVDPFDLLQVALNALQNKQLRQ
jgi:hypothetical protein